MPIARNTIGALVAGGALTATLAALVYPGMLGVQTTSSDPSRITADTQWGSLTERDCDFVVKVRSAGLWEYPLGELALEKGSTAGVKEAGKHLIVGRAGLDDLCRKIAPMLNITLPNQATPQQQQFVATSAAQSGLQFDSTAANIMRVTHGQIFPTIAKIRASTTNTLVRQVADLTNDTVLDHITVLENTGLVNFDQVNFQQTTPPKLPKDQLTHPPHSPAPPSSPSPRAHTSA